jgi:hypothetical protein
VTVIRRGGTIIVSVGAALRERSHSVSIPDDIEMLIPWRIIEDSPEIQNRAEHLSARLASDVPPKHVLCGLQARAVATRIDRDDVLFEVEGGEMPLAVVHMTWRKETDPRWPNTKLFQSWEQWVLDEMLPAHEDYGPS